MNLTRTLLILALAAAPLAHAAAAPSLDSFLREGKLKEGIEAYKEPTDNAGRFSLAALELIEGARKFGLGMTQFALNERTIGENLPFLRLAMPERMVGAREQATPAKIAALFSDLRAAAQRANAAAAAIDDAPFQVEVNLTKARMDLDGDGKAGPEEVVSEMLGRQMGMPPGGMINPEDGTTTDIIIKFDTADGAWLEGYTHVLLGVLDVVTAYDWMPVWNQCAHRVFANPEPLPPIATVAAAQTLTRQTGSFDAGPIADAIATIHELRLDAAHPKQLASARDHFLGMVACSRKCWQRINAETDDDHEWLPSPKQTGPAGVRITEEQAKGWGEVLDEIESVLTGKSLLPHWRLKEGTGINLDKLVKSPPRLDLVLWAQGSAFVPYVESGKVSDQARWNNLTAPFGPGFAMFAIWSN